MDIGESLVGSYFKYVLDCKIVVYNCYPDKEGEIDVVALSPDGVKVYLCEVATHLRGLLYGKNYASTLDRIVHKIKRAASFAATHFPDRQPVFMLWSPVVSRGLSRSLTSLRENPQTTGIATEFIFNREYSKRIRSLKDMARVNIKTTDEPAFRLLQILENMR